MTKFLDIYVLNEYKDFPAFFFQIKWLSVQKKKIILLCLLGNVFPRSLLLHLTNDNPISICYRHSLNFN